MFGRLGLAVAVLAAATMMLIAPAASTSVAAALSWDEEVVNIAHRGASAHAPENTIAALRLADVHDADMVEIDVQETKDHQLVLMHDVTLARTTDAESVYPDRSPWDVSSFTLEEIRELDAGSWFGDRYEGERVPTLGEALSAIRDTDLGLLLEIKAPERYPGIERRIADELRRHPSWLSPSELVVQSFAAGSLRRFDEIMPDVPIGLLGAPPVADLPERARFADLINPPQSAVDEDYVDAVHDLGMEVFTWTVDSAAAMRRVIAAGVDGVITNRPDVLDDVMDD